MNVWQQQVHQFHERFNQARDGAPGTISQPDLQLRRRLIAEEAEETDQALYRLFLNQHEPPVNDEPREQVLADVVDGLCDLLYVVLGTAVSLGLDLDAHLAEVHRANMSKVPLPCRPGEKYAPGGGKGPGWQGPDHVALLRVATGHSVVDEQVVARRDADRYCLADFHGHVCVRARGHAGEHARYGIGT